MSEHGPLYGVELAVNSLPLSGGMRQAMPNAGDLRQVVRVNQRVAGGYEALLAHYVDARRGHFGSFEDGLGPRAD